MSLPYELTFSEARSSAGCWTCRVRRKKCDQRRPICDSCRSLEITCHFGREKPEWMDGGRKKKEMAIKIKAQVKKKAGQRRDRIFTKLLDPDAARVNEATPLESDTSSSTILNRHVCRLDGNFNGDAHFVMIYLDYVFPYLFPHYRPPVHSGGRGWFLDVLQSNEPVHHIVVSLGAHFFGAVIDNNDPKHQQCINIMADKLQKQLELSLKELQSDIRRINSPNCTVNLDEKLLIMQAIVQMVIMEVATKNTYNWKLHLDAAIALFPQIVHGPNAWSKSVESLNISHHSLDKKNNLILPQSMVNGRPWSTGQAALRFFTANLITMDVLSSVSLGVQPRLRSYHDYIIPLLSNNEHSHAPPSMICMEDFSGLHNLTVRVMSDVASLDAWKKEHAAIGRLQTHELLSRGQHLLDYLEDTLHSLEFRLQSQGSIVKLAWLPEDPLPSLQCDAPRSGIADLPLRLASHNKIWLYGISLYLRTIMFGWEPSRADFRNTHWNLTRSLDELSGGTVIRSTVFPFCIGGCLAAKEEEDRYRRMVQNMGSRSFGTVGVALEIMEKVWSSRNEIDESWDIGQCLRILGHPVLLF